MAERTIISRTIEEKNRLRRELGAARAVVDAAKKAAIHTTCSETRDVLRAVLRVYDEEVK